MTLRSLVWRLVDRTGMGRVFSALAEGRLRILCYHGFSFDDEHLFRGKLFMTPARLEQRLEWLKKNRYVVLGLGEAIERLAAGRIRAREIVITIDDGFHSVYALAAPILRSYDVSATIYVTSYYVTHPNPVFRLAIQYMAWKSRLDSVELPSLLRGFAGSVRLHGPEAAESVERFYELAESSCSEGERVSIAAEFGKRVGVDYGELARSRRLSLLSEHEIRELALQGFDIQLHTHRHRLPAAADEIAREIGDNRAVLAPLTNAALDHLCYPSGIWEPAQWPALSRLGVRTATTCVPGLNSRDTPLLALRRFLDGQDIAVEEFSAEMFGVKDLLRQVAGRSRSTSALAAD